jgi:hypothetical protein
MGLHNVEASRENILGKKYSLWSAFAVSSIHHEFLPHLQWSTHHLARVADDSVPGVTDNFGACSSIHGLPTPSNHHVGFLVYDNRRNKVRTEAL